MDNQDLKLEFLRAMSRFKKMGCTFPGDCDFQLVEMSIMERVTQSCEGGICLNVAEIQETLHISKSGVSQTLSVLERKGYITREIDKNDRRKIAVSATPQGQQVYEGANQVYDRRLAQLVDTFGADNLDGLVREIDRLVDVYEQLKKDWK